MQNIRSSTSFAAAAIQNRLGLSTSHSQFITQSPLRSPQVAPQTEDNSNGNFDLSNQKGQHSQFFLNDFQLNAQQKSSTYQETSPTRASMSVKSDQTSQDQEEIKDTKLIDTKLVIEQANQLLESTLKSIKKNQIVPISNNDSYQVRQQIWKLLHISLRELRTEELNLHQNQPEKGVEYALEHEEQTTKDFQDTQDGKLIERMQILMRERQSSQDFEQSMQSIQKDEFIRRLSESLSPSSINYSLPIPNNQEQGFPQGEQILEIDRENVAIRTAVEVIQVQLEDLSNQIGQVHLARMYMNNLKIENEKLREWKLEKSKEMENNQYDQQQLQNEFQLISPDKKVDFVQKLDTEVVSESRIPVMEDEESVRELSIAAKENALRRRQLMLKKREAIATLTEQKITARAKQIEKEGIFLSQKRKVQLQNEIELNRLWQGFLGEYERSLKQANFVENSTSETEAQVGFKKLQEMVAQFIEQTESDKKLLEKERESLNQFRKEVESHQKELELSKIEQDYSATQESSKKDSNYYQQKPASTQTKKKC